MDSSRGTDTFLTAIFFWPLHNVDFLVVCWHLKTLILWFNWYSFAVSTQYFPVLFDVGVSYYPLPGMEKLVHCDKMCEFIRQQEPINAHHNSTAGNVGHFQILLLPSAFPVPFTMKRVWIPSPCLGQETPTMTSSTDHLVFQRRWNESSHHNLIRG